jgi:hypothetical protein
MPETIIDIGTVAWFLRLPEGRPGETRAATEAGLADLTRRCFPCHVQQWFEFALREAGSRQWEGL